MTFSSDLGSFFRRMGTKNVCAGRLRYTAWSLDVTAPAFRAAAVDEIARAYVGQSGARAYRDAAVGVELPARDRMQKGDFGEIIAGSLFNHRLGYNVPFQKLTTRARQLLVNSRRALSQIRSRRDDAVRGHCCIERSGHPK
jgi:hypothetical protein